MVDCPGHFGHIDLARPVYHVGLIDSVRKILKVTCYNCSRLLIDDQDEKDRIKKISYPKQRFFRILESVEKAFRRRCNQEAGGCGFIQPKFMKKSLEITVEHFDHS
jgi:DNA-directed RNA polymerase II subunit RPB1